MCWDGINSGNPATVRETVEHVGWGWRLSRKRWQEGSLLLGPWALPYHSSPSQADLQWVNPGTSPGTSGSQAQDCWPEVYTNSSPGCFPLRQTNNCFSVQPLLSMRMLSASRQAEAGSTNLQSLLHKVQDLSCSFRWPMLTPALDSASTPKFPEIHLFLQMRWGCFCCCSWKNLGLCWNLLFKKKHYFKNTAFCTVCFPLLVHHLFCFLVLFFFTTSFLEVIPMRIIER